MRVVSDEFIVSAREAIGLTPAPGLPLVDPALRIREGVIEEIGARQDLAERYPNLRVTRFDHHAMMPGLVNAHHHVGVTPFQLGVPDMPLELWGAAHLGVPDVDIRLDTLYGAAQMIRSGVTTVQHLQNWYAEDHGQQDWSATRALDAYIECGMRVSLSKMMRDQNLIGDGFADAQIRALSPGLRAVVEQMSTHQTIPIADQLALFDDLRRRYGNHSTVAVQLAPGNLHWLTDAALHRIADFARDRDACLHMHFLETPYQERYVRERTGGLGVRYLDRFGLLTDALTLGHAVWLDDASMSVLVERGVHVCHNCSSNFRLSSGCAPVAAMVKRGVTVAIGIDEAGINDDHDILQEMRMVWTTNRPPGSVETSSLSGRDVVDMATRHGATTTPFRGRIGALEVGRFADVVFIDMSRVQAPLQVAGHTLEDVIVRRARTTEVTDVLINGNWVMRDRTLQTIHESEVLGELHEWGSRARPGDPDQRRELIAALSAHYSDKYRGV